MFLQFVSYMLQHTKMATTTLQKRQQEIFIYCNFPHCTIMLNWIKIIIWEWITMSRYKTLFWFTPKTDSRTVDHNHFVHI